MSASYNTLNITGMEEKTLIKIVCKKIKITNKTFLWNGNVIYKNFQ
jgi:hypothetical protein